jgi:hypothetical protein
MFIPVPESRYLSIPDPGYKKQQQERGEKNLLAYLFCSHRYPKIENYLNFELVKKKKLGHFTKN